MRQSLTPERTYGHTLLETLQAELAALKTDHPKRACQLLSSKRFAPYLSQDENARPYLDRDKVRRAEHLDGKFVLTTNPSSAIRAME